MSIKKNQRGFYVADPISVTRGGTVRVQESSQAVCEGDDIQSGYIWLHVLDGAHQPDRRTVEASAHMSHEQATAVAKALLACVKAAKRVRP